nr:uncharacterized protein LOC123767305 [Procambarus clarkii]
MEDVTPRPGPPPRPHSAATRCCDLLPAHAHQPAPTTRSPAATPSGRSSRALSQHQLQPPPPSAHSTQPQLTSSEMARTGVVVVVVALVVVAAALTHARYLPTRADDSRLEDIRELLREVLERTADGGNTRVTGSGYDRQFLFKRAASEGGVAEVMEPLHNLPQ